MLKKHSRAAFKSVVGLALLLLLLLTCSCCPPLVRLPPAPRQSSSV